MATNPVFNQFNDTMEQNFYEDLVEEAIQMYAHDMFYLPRTGAGEDDLMTEYSISLYEKASPCEFYIQNFSSFEGEGQLLMSYGLDVRDQMTLIVSHRSFRKFVQPDSGHARPFEGDCIYVPMLKNIYQIKYVNSSPTFYTLGKLNTYELVCELVIYSDEIFKTGVPEIDAIMELSTDGEEELENFDLQAQNQTIQKRADDILDFSELDPFEGNY